jgi:hypothetical protein
LTPRPDSQPMVSIGALAVRAKSALRERRTANDRRPLL